MFTGDTGSYHFMGMKISFPYTTESPVKACLLDTWNNGKEVPRWGVAESLNNWEM